MVWGNGLMGFGWRDWVEFWISWPMTLFSEDTVKEKKELREKSMEEAVTANPGCFFVLIGFGLVVFGVVRWLAS